MTDEPAYRADVAYQGAPGAFSEDAAWAMAGTAARLLPCRTLDDVRTALECGRAASAVIPVWNSIAGDVPGAVSVLERPGWRAVASHTLPIIQCLVAANGTSLDQIRDVVAVDVADVPESQLINQRPRKHRGRYRIFYGFRGPA